MLEASRPAAGRGTRDTLPHRGGSAAVYRKLKELMSEDRFDFLVAELKRHGINYIYTTMYI